MPSITPATTLVIISRSLLYGRAYSQSPFSFFSNIVRDFLEDNTTIKASGLDIAPDGLHHGMMSDEGKLVFINLHTYDSKHCLVELHDDNATNNRSNFEGVTITSAIWDPSNMNTCVVHEDSKCNEPHMFKIKCEYYNNGNCDATVVESKSFLGAIPCLEEYDGIKSLRLKTASSATAPAVFFIGIQDTGKVHETTSKGFSNGPDTCYNAELGVEDVSASTYDGTHLWSFIDAKDTMVVVDPMQHCTVATYAATVPANEEYFAIDFKNSLMYVAIDKAGDAPGHIMAYNFTYLDDLGKYLGVGAT